MFSLYEYVTLDKVIKYISIINILEVNLDLNELINYYFNV